MSRGGMTRRLVAAFGLTSAIVLTGATSPASASAVGACTVKGALSFSGIGLLPASGNFGFTAVTFACSGSDVTNGEYRVFANAVTQDETCADAEVSGTIIGGTAPDGSTLSGSFEGDRVGNELEITGLITHEGQTLSFRAHLLVEFFDGVCSGASGPTTRGAFVSSSAAVMDDSGV